MKKILLVDGDPEIREMMKVVIEENPRYLVTGASNGIAACTLLGKDLPGLLILDFVRLGMNGVKVCRIIKPEPVLSGTQVIVITGYVESPMVRQMKDTGFHEITAKPFRLTDLLSTIERVLNGGEKVA